MGGSAKNLEEIVEFKHTSPRGKILNVERQKHNAAKVFQNQEIDHHSCPRAGVGITR